MTDLNELLDRRHGSETREDGVVLFNICHPRLVWWKRPWWRFCQWRAARSMSRYIIEEEIVIDENEEG